MGTFVTKADMNLPDGTFIPKGTVLDSGTVKAVSEPNPRAVLRENYGLSRTGEIPGAIRALWNAEGTELNEGSVNASAQMAQTLASIASSLPGATQRQRVNSVVTDLKQAVTVSQAIANGGHTLADLLPPAKASKSASASE